MARITLSTGTPAELARPSSGTPTRGLVLWPDVGGLRPVFDGHVARLAEEQGWVVCAPELYPGQEDLPVEARLAAARDLSDTAKVDDALAAAAACEVDPVGLLGFCMGGMYVMKSLATHRFDRGVAFYGMVRLPDTWRGGGQRDAIDAVKLRGTAELLCIFGTDDPWCPAEHQDEVEAAGAHVVRYEGADHGWAQDPDRPNYRPDDAADAWARAVAFLRDGPG